MCQEFSNNELSFVWPGKYRSHTTWVNIFQLLSPVLDQDKFQNTVISLDVVGYFK